MNANISSKEITKQRCLQNAKDLLRKVEMKQAQESDWRLLLEIVVEWMEIDNG